MNDHCSQIVHRHSLGGAAEEGQVDFGCAGRMIDPDTEYLSRTWVFVMTLLEPSCALYISQQITNATGFGDPEYDAVCNTAVQSVPGQAEHNVNHLEVQPILAEQLPVVPLYLQLKLAVTRPDMTAFFWTRPRTAKCETARSLTMVSSSPQAHPLR